jgi:hypothetical protein
MAPPLEVAEVIWLLDPLFPFSFSYMSLSPTTFSYRFLAKFHQKKMG